MTHIISDDCSILTQLYLYPSLKYLFLYQPQRHQVLMYSLGRALWNTLTFGLQMRCTDVTVLQLLHVHIHGFINISPYRPNLWSSN